MSEAENRMAELIEEAKPRATVVADEWLEWFGRVGGFQTDEQMAIALTGESGAVICWLQQAIRDLDHDLDLNQEAIDNHMVLLGAWLATRRAW